MTVSSGPARGYPLASRRFGENLVGLGVIRSSLNSFKLSPSRVKLFPSVKAFPYRSVAVGEPASSILVDLGSTRKCPLPPFCQYSLWGGSNLPVKMGEGGHFQAVDDHARSFVGVFQIHFFRFLVKSGFKMDKRLRK